LGKQDEERTFIPLNIQYKQKADTDESMFVSCLTSHTLVSKATRTPAGNDQDQAPSQAGQHPAVDFGPFSMNHGGMPPALLYPAGAMPYQFQNNVALFGNGGAQQMNGVQQSTLVERMGSLV
jgi:hypothetical protein